MKTKALLTVALLGFSGWMYAQRSSSTLTPIIRQDVSLNFEKVIDTVSAPFPAAACIPNLAVGLLTTPAGAQVSGTNGFGDKEKAQLFGYTGGGTITGVLVAFGMKDQGTVGGVSTYNVKLYSKTAAGPGTFLGTSLPVTYSAIDTTGSTTLFSFPTPVAVTDSFFAAVVVDDDVTPGRDSVAVLMFFDGTNPTNVCGNNTAWERWSDDTWHQINAGDSWGVDVEFLIFPIIDAVPMGVDGPSPVSTHRVYPNPATNLVNISYNLTAQSDVKITVFDLAGKQVYSGMWASQNSGAYNQTIDMTGNAAGMYNYTIEAGSHTVKGKLIVQ